MLFHPNGILFHYLECRGCHTGQLGRKGINLFHFQFRDVSVQREGGSVTVWDFHGLSKSMFLRLQKGCVPDQVPLGKHILSEEPIRSKPSEQLK